MPLFLWFVIVECGDMANRARNGHGKLSPRIIFSKEHLRNGGAFGLSRIPAVEHRGRFLVHIRQGKGFPSENHGDDWFSSLADFIDEFFLITGQLEIAVINVESRSFVTAAQRQHNHVGLPRHLHCLCDLSDGFSLILQGRLSVSGHGDLAALRIKNLDVVSNQLPNAVINGDEIPRINHHVGVSIQFAVGMRADDRDGFDLLLVQRRKSGLIFQQDEALARSLQGQFVVGFRFEHTFQIVGVEVWIFKQAQLEFQFENGAHQFIDFRLLNDSFSHQLDQFWIEIGLRVFDVHSGDAGQPCYLRRIVGNPVFGHVGCETSVIGDNHAFEAPLGPQDISQEPFIHRGRYAINLVVRRHDALDIPLLDDLLERREKNVSEDAHRTIIGCLV